MNEATSLDPETAARAFALERHGGQRYGDAPYVVHLEAVRAVLADFGLGGALGVAAWLHDVLEDTPTSRAELEGRFGAEVGALVWAVTGEGRNRRERARSMHEKIRAWPAAAPLKLADRIANVEASRARPDKLALYRAERESFRRALGALGDPAMWARLDRAFDEGR
ncbi:MAG TPA: HD domain-containing protein [Polyangiaceae bacterium]|nr:HD domain-containing protein [Polyangiaceae bacterium]